MTMILATLRRMKQTKYTFILKLILCPMSTAIFACIVLLYCIVLYCIVFLQSTSNNTERLKGDKEKY